MRLIILVTLVFVGANALAANNGASSADASAELADKKKNEALYEAKIDISNNKLIIKSIGPPLPENKKREKLLAKYNVYEVGLGCITSEPINTYLHYYNELVEAEIKKRYGDEFWNNIENELSTHNPD